MIACVCLCVFISNAFLQTNFISSLLAGYCGLWRNSDCLHVDLLMNFCFIVAQHVLLTLTQFLDTNLHLSFVISGYIPLYLFSFFYLNWSGFRLLVPSSLSEQKSMDVTCQTPLVYQSPKALNTYFCCCCQRDFKITSSSAEVPYLITLMVRYRIVMPSFSWICSPYFVSDCTFWTVAIFVSLNTSVLKCGTSLIWNGWSRQYSLCAIFLRGWMHLWHQSSGLSCTDFIAFGFIG